MMLTVCRALLRAALTNSHENTRIFRIFFSKQVDSPKLVSNEKQTLEINPAFRDQTDWSKYSDAEERGYNIKTYKNCLSSSAIDRTNIDEIQNQIETNLEIDTLQSVEDEIDSVLNESKPHPLDECKEDLSYIGPYTTPTYNFAKYANKSKTIQELVKLGVHLYKLERNIELMEFILKLDFERDVKPYLQFLHDCGVPTDHFGTFLTKNPFLLKQDMDDLHTRIRYLRAHSFNIEMIKTILYKNPKWLSYKTRFIDDRLGHFQQNFKLRGTEVRHLTVKHPRLITYKMDHIRSNTFAVREEMGFDNLETKCILLRAPVVWTKCRRNVVDAFDYLHNEMKISHEHLVQEPRVLLCRRKRLEQRHKFLVMLKRAQFDPKQPLYVSPLTLVLGSDLEFCQNIAKVPVDTYNMYLKTL